MFKILSFDFPQKNNRKFGGQSASLFISREIIKIFKMFKIASFEFPQKTTGNLPDHPEICRTIRVFTHFTQNKFRTENPSYFNISRKIEMA